MQIYSNSFTQNYYKKNYYNKPEQQFFVSKFSTQTQPAIISFKGNFKLPDFIKNIIQNPIKNLELCNKEEYLKLTDKQKNKLRNEFNSMFKYDTDNWKLMGEIHAFISDCIKTIFDKEFGENKYVVLPIGRSLSSIGKALSVKIGEGNVVNIPLSNAGRFFSGNNFTDYKNNYKQFMNRTKNDRGLQTFLKFLSDNNLSKENIENSNKNYILMDYCMTGYSLKGAEQLFKSDFVWGNKQKNIYAVDILKLINNFENPEIFSDLSSQTRKYIINKEFETILYYSDYKLYSTVGEASKLEDTIKAAKISPKFGENLNENKLVWFKLIDTIMTKGDKFKAKLKSGYNNNDIFPKQKIRPWHNSRTQYQTDLTDNINEITKFLVQDKLKSESDNSTKIIEKIYKFLETCIKDISNLQYKSDYYKNQDYIQNIINNLNSKMN